MPQVNNQRFIYFRLADSDGNPVTGRQLSDLQVNFLRNGEPCADQLAFAELGSGLYTISYTPSAIGTDLVDIFDPGTGIRNSDVADIENLTGDLSSDNELATLNQDYGGTGVLKVTVSNPSQYTVYVFLSSDWQAGNRDLAYSVGQSAVDANGNWVTPIEVIPDTYTIVALNSTTTIVLAAFLKV